jgi:hypothetical protein
MYKLTKEMQKKIVVIVIILISIHRPHRPHQIGQKLAENTCKKLVFSSSPYSFFTSSRHEREGAEE